MKGLKPFSKQDIIQEYRSLIGVQDYSKKRKVKGVEIYELKNFVGLVQLKNYSTFKNLLREIFILLKLRLFNLFDPRFWFFSLGTILVPRKLLTPLVDNYKNKILSRKLKNIKIKL